MVSVREVAPGRCSREGTRQVLLDKDTKLSPRILAVRVSVLAVAFPIRRIVSLYLPECEMGVPGERVSSQVHGSCRWLGAWTRLGPRTK